MSFSHRNSSCASWIMLTFLQIFMLLTAVNLSVIPVSADLTLPQLLQQLLQKALESQSHQVEPQKRIVSDGTNNDEIHYGSLQKHEVANLIQQLLTNSDTEQKQKEKESMSTKEPDDAFIYEILHGKQSERNDDEDNSYNREDKREQRSQYTKLNSYGDAKAQALQAQLNQLNLEELLQIGSQKRNIKNQQLLKKKNIPPSDLILANDREADTNEYSKVYVILDSEILKTGSKNNLAQLVTQVLNNYSPTDHKQRKKSNKGSRYKGFLVQDNDNARRLNRDSNEMYAPRESMSAEYKPKRQRSRDLGGSGRTAIPYIRHRGDIYEKE